VGDVVAAAAGADGAGEDALVMVAGGGGHRGRGDARREAVPDFGHLEEIVTAAERELGLAGVIDKPEVIVADAGYWHQEQMEKIVERGIPVIIPPDANTRESGRPGRIDRFQRRGRAAAPSEWRLVTATHTLIKLHNHWIAADTG
jgi:hypothetical protein